MWLGIDLLYHIRQDSFKDPGLTYGDLDKYG